MLARGEFDVAQDLAYVDGITEVTANIFAEALHGKIFIQTGERANNFRLTGGSGEQRLKPRNTLNDFTLTRPFERSAGVLKASGSTLESAAAGLRHSRAPEH